MSATLGYNNLGDSGIGKSIFALVASSSREPISRKLPFVGDWDSSFSSKSSWIVELLAGKMFRLITYGVLLGVTFGDCFGEGANFTTFIVYLSTSYLDDFFFLGGDDPPL